VSGRLWSALRDASRRLSGGLVSGGLEAARWIERESLFSLEARAGAAAFLGFAALSLLQTLGAPRGPAAEAAGWAMHVFCFAAAAALGAFLGAAFRSAWNLAGLLAPRVRRGRAPRAARVAAAAAWVLCFHAAFLLSDMARHPALYEPAFYGHGGPLAWLHVFAADRCPPWVLGLLRAAAWSVLLLAAAEWARRLIFSFSGLPLPARLGYAVLGGGLALAALGVWSVLRFQALRNQGTNLLILAAPGLRTDLLEQGASGRRLAPRMNELAGESRAYARCAAPVAAAAPAWATFWTGRTPLAHRVRHSYPSAEDLRFGPDSLPALLRRQGYHTVALTDAGGDLFSRTAREFDRADASDESRPSRARARALARHCHLMPYLSGGAARRLVPALRGLPGLSDPALLAEEADGWLKKLRFRKKFCLTVQFSALRPPHAVASRRALALLDPAYRGAEKYSAAPEDAAPAQARGDVVRPAADAARVRRLYEANARALDDAVGRVLDSLKEWHLDENTVVVLWSPFGQDFERKPGDPLPGWDALAAPLVVREPRRRTPPRWISEPVRQHDAAPTLLDALGLAVPESMEGFPLKQRDFGEPPDEFFLVYAETDVTDPPEEALHPPVEEMLEPDPLDPGRRRVPPGWEEHVLIAKRRMVRLGPLRLVYAPRRGGVRFELYDASDASGGAEDLSRRRGAEDKLQDMKDVFFRFLARENGWRPQNGYWIPEAILEP
jgi:arylsulfatase A-like enzyme